MAEYFENPEQAEDYIRRASRPTVLYARIRLHGSEKWMADHDRRNLGSSITILENLTSTIDRIRTVKSDTATASTERFKACPRCGKTRSPYGVSLTLNVFRCTCGKTYCDHCSGGGLISLPRCPVSPYHEPLQKVGVVPTEETDSAATQKVATEAASQASPPLPLATAAPVVVPTSVEPSRPRVVRNIMVFKTGARAQDEMAYLRQVIESTGLSLKNLSGAHIDNIYYVTPDKLDSTYIVGFVMAAGHSVSNCTLTPFTDRDGGAGMMVKVLGDAEPAIAPSHPGPDSNPPPLRESSRDTRDVSGGDSRSTLGAVFETAAQPAASAGTQAQRRAPPPITMNETPPTNYAGFGQRIAAFMLDFMIQLIAGFIIVYSWSLAFVANGGTSQEGAQLMSFGIQCVLGWIYFAAMESSALQGTLGKMALGIKVTDAAGNRVSFGQATGRYFGKWFRL